MYSFMRDVVIYFLESELDWLHCTLNKHVFTYCYVYSNFSVKYNFKLSK